jgi:hypothetical protein
MSDRADRLALAAVLVGCVLVVGGLVVLALVAYSP